ncbi:MAG: response regulator [Desulfatibacillaceae bacterium]
MTSMIESDAPETGGKASPPLVLLAEDHPVGRILVSRLLETAGFTVVIAKNGREAVDLLFADPEGFDLLLLDLEMPVMDGWEAVRAIREKGIMLPVVALSGHTDESLGERCRKSGMNDYLTKPVSMEALAAVMQQWTGRRGTRPSTSPDLDGEVVFDREFLLSRIGRDEGLAASIAKTFARTAGSHLKAAASARGEGNLTGALGEIHALKGAAANVGARRMAGACLAFEEMATKGYDHGMDDAMDVLAREIEAFKEALDQS